MNYTPAFNFVSFVFSNAKGQNIRKPTCRNCVCLVHRKVKAHACSKSEHHIIFLPRVSGGPNPTPNTLVQLACALVDVGLIIFGIVHFIQLVYYSSILGHPGRGGGWCMTHSQHLIIQVLSQINSRHTIDLPYLCFVSYCSVLAAKIRVKYTAQA